MNIKKMTKRRLEDHFELRFLLMKFTAGLMDRVAHRFYESLFEKQIKIMDQEFRKMLNGVSE